ncbi:hypothetical protein RD792_003656 [Penstemon davidsonii]|uniref:Uncharacterized protein n=1 Tax=Penstemon davidsonii TaxID=160366 RepID=A0ABR0DGF8_9LAMI|nr:hypothetical protein RD792_003656 [Penstemon davidsonii]
MKEKNVTQSHLNLSHNNLSGRIPTGHQLQTLVDPSIYEGSPQLCGGPLPKKCGADKALEGPNVENNVKEDEEDNVDKILFYGFIAIQFNVTNSKEDKGSIVRQAEKVPAGENSDSPKACSRVNWILESESEPESDCRFRNDGEVGTDRVVVESGDRPPSRPNSSSSTRSSSDWKANDVVIDMKTLNTRKGSENE